MARFATKNSAVENDKIVTKKIITDLTNLDLKTKKQLFLILPYKRLIE